MAAFKIIEMLFFVFYINHRMIHQKICYSDNKGTIPCLPEPSLPSQNKRLEETQNRPLSPNGSGFRRKENKE